MFKFEGFTPGQVIRARDFEDRAERGPCFIEGRILAVHLRGLPAHPFALYLIEVTRDVHAGREVFERSRVGSQVCVPMESTMDYDNRVMLAPHDLFDVWSPDQVAECLDGVPTDLYKRLWNDLVPLYDGQPRSEVPDDFDTRCLAKYWDQLTPAERVTLNACAERSGI